MTSPKSFVDFLNERHPENEKVLVALRFYLAEVTHDKLQRELLAEIKDSVGDPHKVQAALDQLKGDRGSQVQVALTFLADRWEDPAERDRIVRAFTGAATKLPVIEASLIAIVQHVCQCSLVEGGRPSQAPVVRAPITASTKNIAYMLTMAIDLPL